MQKKLTCYRCKKKFEGEKAQGNLCEGCRERIAIQVEHLPPDEAQAEYDCRIAERKEL